VLPGADEARWELQGAEVGVNGIGHAISLPVTAYVVSVRVSLSHHCLRQSVHPIQKEMCWPCTAEP
jgi:hypothetical protein